MTAPRTRQQDPALLAVVWGMLWGLALGFWSLAPAIVEAHHLQFESATQRIVFVLVLSAIFVMLGGFLAVIAGFILAAIEAVVVGPFNNRTWAYALFSGVLLVVAYTLDSLLIHWTNFRTLDDFWALRWRVGALVGSCIVACVALAAAYRWIVGRARPLPPAIMAWSLASIAAAGAVNVPMPDSSSQQGPPLDALKPLPSRGDDVPLLFLGIDGASWRVLQPAIEDGSAPTFRALSERGMRGTIDALWPPYWSGAAWAAILTGLPREATGMYEDLAGVAPGLPVFQVPLGASFQLNPIYSIRSLLSEAGLIRIELPSRSMLHGQPIWELLHEAGVDTAVVRFRFTYPPQGHANVMISDWVGYDGWELFGVHREALPDSVTPPDRSDELLSIFRSTSPSDPSLLDELLPKQDRRRPLDSLNDPINALRIDSDIDDRTFEASELILRSNPIQPFLGVYIAGLDGVEHAFWPYHFPGDYVDNPPARADIDRLGPVLPRYVQYLDRRLARLLALYKKEPNVIIVADHGHGPSTFSSGWPGWHTKDGVLLVAGPSVPHTAQPINASYYDILPTAIALKSFEKPASLTGHSLIAIVPEPSSQ